MEEATEVEGIEWSAFFDSDAFDSEAHLDENHDILSTTVERCLLENGSIDWDVLNKVDANVLEGLDEVSEGEGRQDSTAEHSERSLRESTVNGSVTPLKLLEERRRELGTLLRKLDKRQDSAS